MRGKWIRPVHTDNVPTYANRTCSWLYQTRPGELYYQIRLQALPAFERGSRETPRYLVTISRKDVSAMPADERPVNLDGVLQLFASNHCDQLKQTETRNARGEIIEARKWVTRKIIEARGATAEVAVEPTFSDEFDTESV